MHAASGLGKPRRTLGSAGWCDGAKQPSQGSPFTSESDPPNFNDFSLSPGSLQSSSVQHGRYVRQRFPQKPQHQQHDGGMKNKLQR